MATPLIGNLIRSNIKTSISNTTATGTVSGSNQVLSSNILANPTLGSGNYTYQWSQSGTAITFTAATSNSTNCTYASLSVSGSTTIYCTVTDTWTGVKSATANCVITWPVQSTPQNVVISGAIPYSGGNLAYTLTGNPASPAPSGTPTSFTNVGIYTYPTNITSITPGAGYTLGSVSGQFQILPGYPSVSVSIQYYPDSSLGFYYVFVAIFPGAAQNIGIGYSDNFGGSIGNLTGTYQRITTPDSYPAGLGLTIYWNSSGTSNWTGTSGSTFLP